MIGQSFTFPSIMVSPSIEVQGNGIVAVEDIQPWKVLLTINKKDVLCCSNIPQTFCQLIEIIKGHKYKSLSTQIEREILFDNQLLMLYLIHVKNNNKQNPILQQWFKRPLTACYYFQRNLIEKSENYDLLINYVAEHNHLTQLCKFLHAVLGQQRLKMLMNQQEEVTAEDFKRQYEWSYHFVNNRSFGYTHEYTLIPTFDMINHSSNDSNVYQILSDTFQPEKQQLQQAIPQNDSDDNSDNEDEEGPSSAHQKEKYLKNKQFYYHIYSGEKIRKGEEILIQYGQRNNQFLLQGYGFVEENNKYDSLTVYLDLPNEKIYFDSVRGQGCPFFKFKRGRFNWQLFITLKKHYFQQYYKKPASKSKELWSKPQDKKFQQHLFASIQSLLCNNRPTKHKYCEEEIGSRELTLWEQEKRRIFEKEEALYSSVRRLLSGKLSQADMETLLLPPNLQQYATFLQALMAKPKC